MSESETAADSDDRLLFDRVPDPFQHDPGRRYTGNVFILVYETTCRDRGEHIDNPAWPINETVANRAEQQLAANDVTTDPVWEEVTEYPTLIDEVLVDE